MNIKAFRDLKPGDPVYARNYGALSETSVYIRATIVRRSPSPYIEVRMQEGDWLGEVAARLPEELKTPEEYAKLILAL